MTNFENVSFELPETITVGGGTRNGVTTPEVTVEVAQYAPNIIAKLVEHGLRQKLADAMAVSADVTLPDGFEDVGAFKTHRVERLAEHLAKGVWGGERSRSGLTADQRQAMADLFAAQGAKMPTKAKEIAQVYANFPAGVRKAVDAEAARIAKAREDAKAKFKGVKVDLGV